jgi:transcriptional regulator with XRE-family HTH domain
LTNYRLPSILGDMLDLATLGKQISAKRKRLKWSQLDLARKAHVSRATVDALENRRLGELGFSKLTNIMAALGLELKLQEAGLRRPTLEELREEDRDDQSLDRRG